MEGKGTKCALSFIDVTCYANKTASMFSYNFEPGDEYLMM